MEMKEFDVFVVGSGTAGQTVAKACASKGLIVGISDNRAYGGTCPNRGCMPKKVLLAPTEALQFAKSLSRKGLMNEAEIDWKKLQKFKRTFTKHIPKATEDDFKELGIVMYHQAPKFIDKNVLEVEGKTIEAKKIVIASGLTPRKLVFKGVKHVMRSDDFMNLKKLPKHITFIGAGYIGMEFAHMAARAGSKVVMIENGDRILKNFDEDMVKTLMPASHDLGIEFVFNAEVKAISKLRKKYKIKFEKKGKAKILKSYMVINTAGRVPSVDSLALKNANVSYSEKGIEVNPFLQSKSNPDVYACGDVSNHGLPLSPLSGLEGKIVAESIIGDSKKKVPSLVVPSVVFTLPNLASVGLQEAEAKARYKNVSVKMEVVPNWFNAKRINAKYYAYKIIVNDRTNLILGASILGPHAAETINLFSMAIATKLRVKDLKGLIFTYPSWSNDVKSMLP